MSVLPGIASQLAVIVLSGCNFLCAQQPAYFKLGEDQFKGIQIYDMVQNTDLNYLFATNKGLFIFDYYTYEKIECDKARGNSVFNFVTNKEGIIYCHNLNNQVFQIKGRKCTLFYELKNEEATSDISMVITEDDKLLIGAKKIIVLDKEGLVTSRFTYPPCYLGPAFTRRDKSILFHMNGSDSVIIYSKNTFSNYKLHFSSHKPENIGVLFFFTMNGLSYALDLKSKQQYLFNQEKMSLEPVRGNPAFGRSTSVRIYEAGANVWVAGTLPGVILLNNAEQASTSPVFYEDHFISNVIKDREGNILLSTFDKGVLVIPDPGVPDVIDSFRDDPVTSLFTDPSMGLILGTSKGKILNYENQTFRRINTRSGRPIEGIYGNAGSDFIVFDDGFICVYNKQTKQTYEIAHSSLKDAVVVSENEMYLGTNTGVLKVTTTDGHTFTTEAIKNMDQRIYSIEYDPLERDIYVAASNGMFRIPAAGDSITKILYKKEDIFPIDLLWHDSILFVSTNKDGVLMIRKNRVIDSIKVVVNGKPEALEKISFYRNTIIAKSSNGLFRFDRKGKVLKQFHSIGGFSSKRVIDFALADNSLWVSHSGGVQEIDPEYLQSDGSAPVIRIDKVFVNNEATDPGKNGDFNSDRRKIRFVFSSPTLRSRETIRYYYRLAGYEKDWTVAGYTGNDITYNALGAGNYTFMVKVESGGVFSKPVSYAFSISSPLYMRWWFIATAACMFLVMVLIIYRRQLKIQRKKSEQISELNASKLTAIQSQMNPHFIFNALNSVQDLILKGDVEQSYTYITTFSNLVRRTLNYSEKDFIDFDQEIKLLELYLSLEKLRFKKSLDYEIKGKDIEDIMLPPLLVQPFIENALVHGLLHREGNKKLKITFELKDLLICTIEDNGIGREKAKLIRQRQQPEHESFSGHAIHKRFEILSNVFGGDFGYVYEDLYENDQPAGTKVSLMIPVKRRF